MHFKKPWPLQIFVLYVRMYYVRMYRYDMYMIYGCIMPNKNSLAIKKCEANQKQQ